MTRKSETTHFVIAAAVMLIAAGCGEPRVFTERLDQFLKDAQRLEALTSQGVTIDKFGDQLATVRADYELLRSVSTPQFRRVSEAVFVCAIEGWELTYTVWKRGNRTREGEMDKELDAELIDRVSAYAPGKAPALMGDPGAPVYYSFSKTIRVLMAEAAENFERGRGTVAH